MAFAFDCARSTPDFDGAFHGLEAELYDYWLDIHPGDNRLPGRQHFDPTALPPQMLQHLWLVDVEREPMRFRLRLVGSAVRMASPFARAGTYVDEFIGMATRSETLLTSFTRIVETRAPEFRQSDPRIASSRHARGLTRLSLPLASDGCAVDMILNITTYTWASGRKPGFGLPR